MYCTTSTILYCTIHHIIYDYDAVPIYHIYYICTCRGRRHATMRSFCVSASSFGRVCFSVTLWSDFYSGTVIVIDCEPFACVVRTFMYCVVRTACTTFWPRPSSSTPTNDEPKTHTTSTSPHVRIVGRKKALDLISRLEKFLFLRIFRLCAIPKRNHHMQNTPP